MKMHHGIKIFAISTTLLTLAGCGQSTPSKSEVRDFMARQVVEAAQAQHDLMAIGVGSRAAGPAPSVNIDALEKKIDIQGLDCKAEEGFKNVWKCKVSAIVSNQPISTQYRFYRGDDGKLNGEEQN